MTDIAHHGSADLPGIVSLAYEAALDPSLQTHLVSQLKAFLSADFLVWLNTNGLDRQSRARPVYTGIDAVAMDEYARLGWSSPLVPGMLRAQPCQPLTPDMLVAPGELERSAFHEEWVRPNNVGGAMLSILSPISGPTVIITAMREKSPRPIGFEDDGSLASYRLLLPYLGRAAAFAERLQRNRPEPHGASAALDMFRVPTFCLDARLRPVWMNMAAETLLRRRIAPAPRRAPVRRHRRRDRAPARRPAHGRSVPWSFDPALAALGRRGAVPHRHPRPLHAGPMQTLTEHARSAHVMVFVFDHADHLAAAEYALHARLRALFGLTPTEALICIQIAHGAGIPAIAKPARLKPPPSAPMQSTSS